MNLYSAQFETNLDFRSFWLVPPEITHELLGEPTPFSRRISSRNNVDNINQKGLNDAIASLTEEPMCMANALLEGRNAGQMIFEC